MTSNRFAWVVSGAVLLLVVVTGLLVAMQPRTDIAPGSPADAVQRYVKAVMAGDHDRAAELFSTDSTCDAADLDRSYADKRSRVDLIDTVLNGDRARVQISIVVMSDDLVQNTWAEERTIRLHKTDGQWLITGIPWPLYECGVLSK